MATVTDERDQLDDLWADDDEEVDGDSDDDPDTLEIKIRQFQKAKQTEKIYQG